ncbi:GNAT family N-acetyltransferase [Patescibacteria group bacterium]|nr:GNAT family N-acetyltransferase [Patescibacteria group bacterium]
MTNLKAFSKERVLAKIKELKQLPFGEVFINCKFNGVDYKLIFLTSECGKDANLMNIIGGWRKKNEIWFACKFEVTVERTTKWFKERLIDAPDRLLFIIKVGNEYIGHVGLFRFDFENGTCEIDNIIRGESGYPGIMNDAIRNMMDWGKAILGLKGYSLKTFLDNERAVRLYEKLGFKEISRIPMIQVEGKDGLEWVEAPEGYDGEINKYDLVMKLF